MHRHFESELDSIGRALLSMAARVESQLRKAIRALEQADPRLAEEVRAGDPEINEMENEIEERCINQIALQAPVAHDLRFLIGAIKINSDLERMADHAVNIAHVAARLPTLAPLERPVDLHPMTIVATEMLRDALDAYVNKDVARARAVCARDDEMDSMRDRLMDELRDEMIRSPKSVPRALELLLATRNLERISDLATNIAEEVAYIADARVLRHHAEEKGKEGRREKRE